MTIPLKNMNVIKAVPFIARLIINKPSIAWDANAVNEPIKRASLPR